MKSRTITPEEFLTGSYLKKRPPSTHKFRAEYTPEEGIKVFDENGNQVDVEFSATLDGRSVWARVEGVGFIGGWQYPHRAMPWKYLAESINKGILYHSSDQLPKKYTR
ncbi:MAG: hypothetical protein K6U74_02450 [Firmicutes bacterium]|nr:hypothetical protein [Bacillota bacterium]